MSKLLVLKSLYNNEVISITEYKYHMKLFILQNNYSRDNYELKIYTNKDKINKYLIKYEEFYLIEYNNFIIRSIDKKYIEDILYRYKKEIKDIIEKLDNINSISILNIKDHSNINNTINILSKNIKKDNFNKFINLDSIIRDYYNNHDIINSMIEYDNNYNYKIMED